jgi:hypothetical protein
MKAEYGRRQIMEVARKNAELDLHGMLVPRT